MAVTKTFKTIPFQVPANAIKSNQITAMINPLRDTLSWFIEELDKDFIKGEPVSKFCPFKLNDTHSILSARQFQTIYAQAKETYSSYLAIISNKFKYLVMNSNLNDFTKMTLYRINKIHGWYLKDISFSWINKNEELAPSSVRVKDSFKLGVTTELLKLTRYLIKRVKCWITRPDMTKVSTFKLDAKVAELEISNTSKHFNRWIALTTLTRGKPVRLPLKNNPYFEKELKGNKLLKFIQLSIKDNELIVSPIIELKTIPLRNSGEAIGLDFGLVHLFSTSDGRLFGNKMLKQLRIWDKILCDHDAELAKNGIARKNDSIHIYWNNKIRSYVKNEIGRILNKLPDEDLSELVVEHLKFSGGGLSKRMNRLITRVGRSAITAKFNRLRELKGVKITEVNPAYTSQECNTCGYTSKKNRMNQNRFICKCCGSKSNADVNAAKNIRDRRSISISWNGSSPTTRKTLLNILLERHKERCPSGKCQATVENIGSTGRTLV